MLVGPLARVSWRLRFRLLNRESPIQLWHLKPALQHQASDIGSSARFPLIPALPSSAVTASAVDLLRSQSLRRLSGIGVRYEALVGISYQGREGGAEAPPFRSI